MNDLIFSSISSGSEVLEPAVQVRDGFRPPSHLHQDVDRGVRQVQTLLRQTSSDHRAVDVTDRKSWLAGA